MDLLIHRGGGWFPGTDGGSLFGPSVGTDPLGRDRKDPGPSAAGTGAGASGGRRGNSRCISSKRRENPHIGGSSRRERLVCASG